LAVVALFETIDDLQQGKQPGTCMKTRTFRRPTLKAWKKQFRNRVLVCVLFPQSGMAFQRFALTASKLGLSLSFLNPPCQISQVRDKMMSDTGLNGAYPQLLIRMGYSKKMPCSFRRRINSFTNHHID